MNASVIYVGMDVHKDSIVIAVARDDREEAETWQTIPYDGVKLRKVLKSLIKNGEVLRVCYEAGPTGFGLCRGLRKAGIDCIVVAPSLVPSKSGDKVKTDRRDARKLAHFLRSGDLTEVHVPEESVEAIRDLERARDDAKCAERVGATPVEQVSPAKRATLGRQRLDQEALGLDSQADVCLSCPTARFGGLREDGGRSGRTRGAAQQRHGEVGPRNQPWRRWLRPSKPSAAWPWLPR